MLSELPEKIFKKKNMVYMIKYQERKDETNKTSISAVVLSPDKTIKT